MKPSLRLILSIGAAVVAALLMGGFMMNVSQQSSTQINRAVDRYGAEVADVAVAARTIEPGTRITEDMVTMVSWPTPLVAGTGFASAEDVIGKVAGARILPNEPIVEERLGGTAVASISVPNGFAAFSFPANPVYAVGGAIKAGDKVDLWAVFGEGSSVIVEGVEVLATSATQPADADADDAGSPGARESSSLSWVTVAVDPGYVNSLVTVAESSRIHIVLPGTSGGVTAEAE